ncbi:hypothetical protein [Candidatus Lokiarchaeum ossiferum]|uniref:hypothetical protein n=1 Tax=Candidatus Lokiarchaeum ossiferum TaxID=2951803 RepID=UPI00352DB65B
MKEYPNLKPIFASSTMHVWFDNKKVQFSNNIIYDYLDLRNNSSWKSFKHFLAEPKNYEQEITTNWNNLQMFLDQERNIINGIDVNLKVQHCGIQFRDQFHPFVKWIVEFEGPGHFGTNNYENIIEQEILEYPIYSLYIFDKSTRVMEVTSSISYEINPNRRIIEYFGQKGDILNGYEKISFSKGH